MVLSNVNVNDIKSKLLAKKKALHFVPYEAAFSLPEKWYVTVYILKDILQIEKSVSALYLL